MRGISLGRSVGVFGALVAMVAAPVSPARAGIFGLGEPPAASGAVAVPEAAAPAAEASAALADVSAALDAIETDEKTLRAGWRVVYQAAKSQELFRPQLDGVDRLQAMLGDGRPGRVRLEYDRQGWRAADAAFTAIPELWRGLSQKLAAVAAGLAANEPEAAAAYRARVEVGLRYTHAQHRLLVLEWMMDQVLLDPDYLGNTRWKPLTLVPEVRVPRAPLPPPVLSPRASAAAAAEVAATGSHPDWLRWAERNFRRAEAAEGQLEDALKFFRPYMQRNVPLRARKVWAPKWVRRFQRALAVHAGCRAVAAALAKLPGVEPPGPRAAGEVTLGVRRRAAAARTEYYAEKHAHHARRVAGLIPADPSREPFARFRPAPLRDFAEVAGVNAWLESAAEADRFLARAGRYSRVELRNDYSAGTYRFTLLAFDPEAGGLPRFDPAAPVAPVD